MNENTDNGVKVPNGQINYNTVGASAGIASFLGLNAGNFLGGLNNNPANNNRFVTQSELCYAKELDKKESEISRLKSEKYTDNHILEAFKETSSLFKAEDEKIASVVKETTAAFIESNKQMAVLQTEVACLKEQIKSMNDCQNQKLDYEIKGVYRELNSTKRELEGAVSLESERRKCGDENLYCYVNGTFVPGKLIMPSSSICPPPMDRYNSWTAPTSTTATT